jgi:diaminohydroxyphosphoribosylaminopyrimidine deaminase/5-amino-6-(5-phosphoribosylamino)uracil reductase
VATAADDRFIARAIELARGPAFTSPNPRVGAVVVRDGVVLGEGAHEGAGEPHAESLALEGIDAAGATLYVSLEPCIHHGRTPPCVPRILEAGIARVVAPIADPDEHVAGKGFAALTEAGVDVEVGPLAEQAEALNAPYLHHRRTGASFISLKLAMSLDGAIAAADGSARWISGADARRIVHARRQEADAVMVGASTVIADDPELTVRDVSAKRQPLRVIVDASGRVPATARVFSAGAVLVATTDAAPDDARSAWSKAGAEILTLPQSALGVDLHALVKHLGARDVLEILCEGGAQLATSLLRDDLVGRLELHYGPLLLGGDGIRIGPIGVGSMDNAHRWRVESTTRLGDDLIVIARPRERTV